MTHSALKTAKKRAFWIVFSAFLGVLFAFIPEVMASSFLPLPSNENLDVPAPEGDTAVERFENLLGPLALAIRIIVGAVAEMLMVISGFTMVLGGENEETVSTQKQSMTYGIVGLILVSIAGPVAEIFDFRAGNIVADDDLLQERVQLFDDTTGMVVTFIKYLLGSLAALMFIRAGATLVMSGGSEEDISREKKNLAYASGGLIVVILSDLVIRKILFDAEFNSDTSETVVAINQNELVTQIVAVTNLLVTFVGPIMMLGIVIGGILYVTAGGDEERTGLAKKIIINCIIGVAIIYGAFALVSTVITGVF